MKRKQSELLVHAKPARKSARHISDADINFSDVPELTSAQLKQARRVGRPKSGKEPKKLIAIRLEPTLIRKLQELARDLDKHYQTLIHELLEKAVKKAA